jgi:hypothetical protein
MREDSFSKPAAGAALPEHRRRHDGNLTAPSGASSVKKALSFRVPTRVRARHCRSCNAKQEKLAATLIRTGIRVIGAAALGGDHTAEYPRVSPVVPNTPTAKSH